MSSDAEQTKMTISLNGEPTTLPAGLTIAGLLQRLGKDPRLLAVEQNRQLVSRKRHDEVALADGDRIEVVTLVGGG